MRSNKFYPNIDPKINWLMREKKSNDYMQKSIKQYNLRLIIIFFSGFLHLTLFEIDIQLILQWIKCLMYFRWRSTSFLLK